MPRPLRSSSFTLKFALALGVSLTISGPAPLCAAPGELDPSFQGTGLMLFGGNFYRARGLAVQPDGKILLSGTGLDLDPPTPDWLHLAVWRLHADGSADTSFANGSGRAALTGALNSGFQVLLRGDGRILVSGSMGDGSGTPGGPHPDSILASFLPNGLPDPAFGPNGSGVSISPHVAYNSTTTLLPDGKVVTTGFGIVMGQVGRWLPDGTPDASFGTGGVLPMPPGISGSSSIAAQSDGKVLLASEEAYKFALMRLLPNGAVDSAFGSAGTALIPSHFMEGPFYPGPCRALTVLPDGKILAAGLTRHHLPNQGFILARFLPDGSLDPSFGDPATPGHTVFYMDATSLNLSTMLPQSDGRIVLVGSGGDPGGFISVVRFTAGGLPDHTFGSGGRVKTTFRLGENSVSATLQPDGKLLVLGGRFGGNMNMEQRLLLMRFQMEPGGPGRQETWRTAWFGSPDNSGPGADTNDFDHDGLPNFLEYALGTNPHVSTPPPCQPVSGNPGAFTYTRPTPLTELSFQPEYAPSPAGPWSSDYLLGSRTLTNDGTVQTVQVTFTATSLPPRLYFRLRVTRLFP